jgi:pimeloyl-ACP methyl ester carboxylesterase
MRVHWPPTPSDSVPTIPPALPAQLALGPIHILGASMGGMIAQQFALHYPAQVRSLTLVCTVPKVEPFLRQLIPSRQTIRRQCTREACLEMDASWLFTHRFYEDPEAIQRFMQKALAHPFPQAAAALLRQCEAGLTYNALGRLGSVTVPTHVIVGEEDILTPHRLARVLAEQIPGARLTVIPESGHGVFWGKATEFRRRCSRSYTASSRLFSPLRPSIMCSNGTPAALAAG